MSYTKTNWVNGQAPAINADNLNKIENKLYDLDSSVSSLDTNKLEKTAVKTSTTTSATDTYSCTYINTQVDNLKAYSLYDNSTGTTGDVTLSDSSANYNYLEIFYKNVDGLVNSTKVYSPNGKYANLLCAVSFTGGTGNNALFALHSRCVTINTNKIKTLSTTNNGSYYAGFALWSGGSPTVEINNYISIIKVVGYK